MSRALVCTLALLCMIAALPAQAQGWGDPVPEANVYDYPPAPEAEGGYQVAINEWYRPQGYPAPPPARRVIQPNYGSGYDDYYVPNQGLYRAPATTYNPYQYGAPQVEQPRYKPQKRTVARGPAPEFRKAVVPYEGGEAPGTIVVDTPARYLYLVQNDGTAIRYGIGVGKPGFEWSGEHAVTAKKEWPSWTPPAEMLERRPDLPRHMVGGPQNPLGARALYLGSTLYRIHGSNEPWSIGHAVSSGCIRMTNDDVIDLYERVPVGARVIVI